MSRNIVEATDNITSSLEEVHRALSQIRISDEEQQGQNVDVTTFLSTFESLKESLERHIESHKDSKLPIHQGIVLDALRLVQGILQLDLESFSSTRQPDFAGYFLNILGYNCDYMADYLDILRDLHSERLKILGSGKSSPAKPQRYMEESLCVCPATGYPADICISQAVKRLLRAALPFYNMVYVNQKIRRDSAITSLKNYRFKVRQILDRLQYLAENRCSPPCAALTLDTTSTMSTPLSRSRQTTIREFFTPRQSAEIPGGAGTPGREVGEGAAARRHLDFENADEPEYFYVSSDSD